MLFLTEIPRTLYSDNTVLTKDKKFTFLNQDATAGATALGIASTVGFHSLGTSSGQIICVGEVSQEKTEIVRTSNTSGPGGVSIPLRDALQFDHPQDTKVYIIDWNRVQFQYASTVTGTKSTLEAYPRPVEPDHKETPYRDTAQTSGFYFVRFNESITDTNSDFSDAIPYGGFAFNTVHAVKQRALDSINEKLDDEIITGEFLNESLWEARRELHQVPGKRPWRRKFNTDIGNVSTGMYRIDLPADVEKPYTAENVFGVRIGAELNMEYYDKKSWDFDFQNVPHSTLTSTYTVGARDLYVDSARDFKASGVVSIAQTNVEYSARSISGGTLRISTQGSYSVDNVADVWQNISYGLPDRFTVFATPGGSAFIYFNRAVDTAYVDQNIFADYYRTVVDYDSDADTLDEPDPDTFVPYLAFKMKKRRDRTVDPATDPDYKTWTFKKNNTIAAEYIGEEIRIRPQIDHLDFPS